MAPSGSWDIVCLAGMDWDENWTSRQQLMSRLARRHRVLYVERSYSPFTRFSGVIGGKRAGQTPVARRWAGDRGGELVVARPPLRLPLRYHSPIDRLNAAILRPWLRRQVRLLNWAPDVLWTFEPDSARLVGCAGERLALYHCVDEHAAYRQVNPRFAWARRPDDIRQRERQLVARVQMVLASSPALADRIRQSHPNVHCVPHGADVAAYGRAVTERLAPPPDVSHFPRPLAAFVGMIDGRLDTDLLNRLVADMGDWSFVFIGHERVVTPGLARLKQSPNVHFVGFRSIQELPAYMGACDVCMIPYRDDDFTRGIFPLKLFEYLAAGKGVVATRLPGLVPFAEPGVLHIAGDVATFRQALVEVADASAAAATRRARRAAEHTWSHRLKQIEHLVGTELAAR